MKNSAGILGVVALVIAVIGGAIWWQVYRFQECKKVGHSTFYCAFTK